LILSNLHCHTTYSDGANTPKDMIKKAVDLNFKSIGISEHAQCGYDILCPELNKEDQINYFELLDSYKEEFPQIEIFKGLELDSLNPTYEGKVDYAIGSIHFLKINNEIYPIDYDYEKLKELIDICGTPKSFVIKYYEEIISFAKTTQFDIVGHLDLYNKFNEKNPLFSVKDKWHTDIINNTIEELTELNKIIEINTGAMGKGYRSEPYPDFSIFKSFKDLNAKIMVNSDSHSINTLNYGFDLIEKKLKENNIYQIYTLTKNGFIKTDI
jgi:histidinol-phosphatase (PHP family)